MDAGRQTFNHWKGTVMAQVTNVKLTDDLDGTKAAETVSFALDGSGYQIDLSAKNAKALRKVLAEFVAAGRSVRTAAATNGRPAGRRTPRRHVGASDAATIRAWANQNNVPVSIRGRVSAEVRAQYAQAHGK